MDIQKKEVLIAEIERFKEEAMKSYVVSCWAESYTNTDPFGYVILENENNKVWWLKTQAYQLWEMWQAAQAVPEGFVLVPSGVLDLTRFMCETWAEIDKFVYKNCQNLELYPLIQGSKTQSAIRKIGNQKFNPFAVGVGIQAMIEAQEPAK